MAHKKRYALVIDSKKCIDCKACVVACRAENNVPLRYSRNWIDEEHRAQAVDTGWAGGLEANQAERVWIVLVGRLRPIAVLDECALSLRVVIDVGEGSHRGCGWIEPLPGLSVLAEPGVSSLEQITVAGPSRADRAHPRSPAAP